MLERSAFDTVEGALGQHKLTRESMTRIHGVVMAFVSDEAAKREGRELRSGA